MKETKVVLVRLASGLPYETIDTGHQDIIDLITELSKYSIATTLIRHERYGELREYALLQVAEKDVEEFGRELVRRFGFALGHLSDYNRGDKTVTLRLLLRKDRVADEETRRPKIEEIMSDEWEKTKADFRGKIATTRNISESETIEIFKQGISGAREIFEARLVRGMALEVFYIQKAQGLAKKQDVVFESQPKGKEPLTTPDLSEIPRWQGRRKDGMPLGFIKTHYGQWLSAFGAEQDSIFQDQIRMHDPGLIKGVHNQFREEKKRRKLHDFVKTRSARVDTELQDVNVRGVLRKAGRLDAALRRRQKKT